MNLLIGFIIFIGLLVSSVIIGIMTFAQVSLGALWLVIKKVLSGIAAFNTVIGFVSWGHKMNILSKFWSH